MSLVASCACAILGGAHADPGQWRTGASGLQPRQPQPRQVERLEVTKAPTADQSAQAIAGTLNIILKDAPAWCQKDARIGFAYAAEKPVLNAGFTYGDRALGGLGFVLPVSFYQWHLRTRSDSERLGRDRFGQPQRLSGSSQDKSFGRGINFSPRLTWKLGDDESLSLQGFAVQTASATRVTASPRCCWAAHRRACSTPRATVAPSRPRG